MSSTKKVVDDGVYSSYRSARNVHHMELVPGLIDFCLGQLRDHLQLDYLNLAIL